MKCLIDMCIESGEQTLLKKVTALKHICLPSKSILAPSFRFKKQEEFSETDVLLYGSSGVPLAPNEISQYSYQDRQTLRDSNVDFIKAGNQKWFYNTWDLQGNFFSEDGRKKVEVDFNFWIDAEKIWSIPGIKQAMRSILTACSGDSFPTEAEAQQFFTEDLCSKIYRHQPATESIKQAVLELIEPLRKKLASVLVNTYAPKITTSKKFKQYVQENPAMQSKATQDQLTEYFKKNKNAVYLFGEKFGLIKAAAKAIHYQDVRDSVRHPQEVQAILSQPQKVYDDFCTILMIPKQSNRYHLVEEIIENFETAKNLEHMSNILDIIAIYESKSLKRKNPAYWQDLVNQGILTSTEVPYVQTMVKACASVGHINADSDVCKNIVINDGKLLEISLNMQGRHEQKQAQKNAQLQEWIDGTSR